RGTLARTCTWFWRFLGQQATQQTPEFRNCFVVLDADGKAVDSWTQWDHLCADGRGPHPILISPYDHEQNVWVVDDIHHQIWKFTNDGKKLLMTLGERDEPGNDPAHFKRPPDIAFLPDGTFFVSDGYGNSRVVKFDKNGKFLTSWGTKGNGPSQFNLAHCVAVEAQRRVYVADRSNHRIQVFDENGKFLDEWPNIPQPHHLMITEDQHMWVSDGTASRLLEYDLSGKLLTYWGTQGTAPGYMNQPHSFGVDTDGALYVANGLNHRVEKFVPQAGADRNR